MRNRNEQELQLKADYREDENTHEGENGQLARLKGF